MSKARYKARYSGWIFIIALVALVVPWSLVQASKSIHESRAADPRGEVEIFNLAGKVEVEGWDRSEVEVSGTAGDGVERVDVSDTAAKSARCSVLTRRWALRGGSMQTSKLASRVTMFPVHSRNRGRHWGPAVRAARAIMRRLRFPGW